MELFNESKIEELETKIEKLITLYKSTKEEKERLSARIQTLEAENKELKDRINGSKVEREQIANKITKILERLEKVEV
ncbi:MAG: cell division protein ZapB [Syntrophorhabdaceae bacterium]|nr:cell division protein ZapB [Syntrophorhabdaceae bacterium]